MLEVSYLSQNIENHQRFFTGEPWPWRPWTWCPQGGVFGGGPSFKNMSAGGRLCTFQENPHFWVPTLKVRPLDGKSCTRCVVVTRSRRAAAGPPAYCCYRGTRETESALPSTSDHMRGTGPRRSLPNESGSQSAERQRRDIVMTYTYEMFSTLTYTVLASSFRASRVRVRMCLTRFGEYFDFSLSFLDLI